jgi:hypothetical protein
VQIHRGIPEIGSEFADGKHRLLIIDDQSSECNEQVAQLFTRKSHHFSCSIILLTQNIFLANPWFRTISLNAHYIVIFKAPRSKDQISVIARQCYPQNTKFFQQSYDDCCSEPYSYMLLDLTQGCPEQLRIRSKIFPDDTPNTVIYTPV